MGLGVLGCGGQRRDQRWVKDLELEGARTLDEDEVLDGLETRKTGWWPCAEKQWFDTDAVAQDLLRIEAYYAAHGFFEARVRVRAIVPDPEGRHVRITLAVEEGEPTRVSDVTIHGMPDLNYPKGSLLLGTRAREVICRDEPAGVGGRRRPAGLSQPGQAAALLPVETRGRSAPVRTPLQRRVCRPTDALSARPGQRFDHGAYSLAKQVLAQRLKELGYAYARVDGVAQVDRRARRAVIRLTAVPGPLVRFGATRFEGAGDVPEDRLRLLVDWKEGDLYDESRLKQTRARLFKLRLFSAVRLEIPKQPVTPAPVTIKLWPTQRRELRLGLGVGFESKRHEVRLSGRWTLRNILGGLRVLEVMLKPAFVSLPTFWESERLGPALESEVKLTQPYLWGSLFSVHASLNYDLDVKEGYQVHGPGVELGASYPFFEERLWAGLSWNLEYLDFFNIEEAAYRTGASELKGSFLDPYRVGWLTQYGELDLRDSVTDPRVGLYAALRLEEGFPQVAGEFTYLKISPELRGYLPVFTRRLVLALRAQLGYLLPLGSPDSETAGEPQSPITHRFAYGGPNSHRGFSFGRLSPQGKDPVSDKRVPLGGDGALLFSADLRLRVIKIFGYWLGLSAFFDAGDVTADFEDLSMARLHLSVGGSLQYETPIGYVRFAVGVRLNRLDEIGADGLGNPDPGDRMAYHLTLGEAF